MYTHNDVIIIMTSSLHHCSDEDTDIRALVTAWLKALPVENPHLEGWLDDHFYHALDWVMKASDFVVDTTLVGVAMNGLSHLVGVRCKAEFACALVRGLGGNLAPDTQEKFAKEVRPLSFTSASGNCNRTVMQPLAVPFPFKVEALPLLPWQQTKRASQSCKVVSYGMQ